MSLSILRVPRDDVEAAAPLGAAFGAPWPLAPNTIVEVGFRVACLAPGEWALFAPADQVADQVAQACSGRLHHLSDVSAGRRLWRISGSASRAVIAKGCSLDTHPSVMTGLHCAQSLLTQAPVLLVAQPAISTFDIVADASFAGHLRAWFLQAAQEFIP
ncbi:sarcosine oxidase subunit gamma [Caulobacter soli]|uniref:sarcosine oxidase subunit gamma n=1 Tax=Caulobacter soli TaxID=2708539 RepID=UPI0013EE230E|nr:sarcosine oxidase subunit gamma family protein [Caulobacter soli]